MKRRSLFSTLAAFHLAAAATAKISMGGPGNLAEMEVMLGDLNEHLRDADLSILASLRT